MAALAGALEPWAIGFVAFAAAMLVQSTVVILLWLVVDRLIGQRMRPAVRYALWLLALVKLVLPPGLALPTSVAYWVFTTHEPARLWAGPSIETVLVPGRGWLPAFDIERIPAPADAQASSPLVHAVRETAGLSGEAAGTATARWQETVARRGPMALLAIWLAGVGWFAASVVRAGLAARRLRRMALDPTPALEAMVEGCRRELRVRRRIAVRCTPFTHAPAVYGVVRPVILLPVTLAQTLAATELRAVLLHEVAHCRRWDSLANGLQVLVQIAYWYHPLVWVANARLRQAREHAVDDVVRVRLGDATDVYPRVLVRIAAMTLEARNATRRVCVGMFESRGGLTRRVERMLRTPVPEARTGTRTLALTAVAAFVVLPSAPRTVGRASPPPITVVADAPTSDVAPGALPVSSTPREVSAAAEPVAVRATSTAPRPQEIDSARASEDTAGAPTRADLSEPQAAVSPGPPEPPRTFDAVRIARHMPDGRIGLAPGGTIQHADGVFRASDMTVSQLVSYAYRVWGAAVIDAPEWMRTVRYDVTVPMDASADDAVRRLLLQALLRERFGLALREELREIPGYAVVVAPHDSGRSGPCTGPVGRPAVCAAGDGSTPWAPINSLSFEGFGRPGSVAAAIAAWELEAPVVDATGTAASEQVRLYYYPQRYPLRSGYAGAWTLVAPSPEAGGGADGAWSVRPRTHFDQGLGYSFPVADVSRPSLHEALARQLGLALEATPMRVGAVVVESAKQPDEP